jgi:hypothetical protein
MRAPEKERKTMRRRMTTRMRIGIRPLNQKDCDHVPLPDDP